MAASALYEMCSSERTEQRGVCSGYLAGFLDTLGLYEAVIARKVGRSLYICLPEGGVRASVLRELFRSKYLDSNKKMRRTETARIMLTDALEPWHCKRPASPAK